MVASPALVPSPSPQHAIMTGQSRSVNSVGKVSNNLGFINITEYILEHKLHNLY